MISPVKVSFLPRSEPRREKGLVCLNCTLPICVEGHVECLYRIVTDRPPLKVLPEKRTEQLAQINRERHDAKLAAFEPDTRFGLKYDKRRKPDTPRRQWERGYRRRKRQEADGRAAR